MLGWAYPEFGPPSAASDDGGWSFELQAVDERDAALAVDCDLEGARAPMAQAPEGRVTMALTLSGPRAFGEAFAQAFPGSD